MERLTASMIAVFAVALGVFAPTATAKGPYSARVCGADACREVETLPPLVSEGSPVIAGDRTTPPGPFYRITVRYEREASAPLRLVYVPSRRILSGFGGWKRVDSRFPAGIRKTLRGLAPFPAPAQPRSSAAIADAAPSIGLEDGGSPPFATTFAYIALAALAAFGFGAWSHRRRST